MSWRFFIEIVIGGYSSPLLILLASAFRRSAAKRWLDVTTVIGYTVYVAVGFELMGHNAARTYDPAFLRADALLRFNPIGFADELSRHPLVIDVLLAAYCALPFVIGLSWLIEQDLQMRRAVLLAGCFCFVFYWLFPAVGPGHFDWSLQLPKPRTPDNCMPSMHLTWALLLAINARSMPLRLALWFYVALMAVATLALREHYLIDLIAALPYALAVQSM